MSIRLLQRTGALLLRTMPANLEMVAPSVLPMRRKISSSPMLRQAHHENLEQEVNKLRQDNEALRRKLDALQSADAKQTAEKQAENSQSLRKRESEEDFGDSLVDSMSKAINSAFRPFSALFKDTPMEEMLRDVEKPLRNFNKVFAGMDESIRKEAEQEINRVREAAADVIRKDHAAVAELGSDIQLGHPFAQSFSSSTINGETSRHIVLQMPICGNKSSGATAVEAHIDHKGNLIVARCALQVGGRSLHIGVGGSGNRERVQEGQNVGEASQQKVASASG